MMFLVRSTAILNYSMTFADIGSFRTTTIVSKSSPTSNSSITSRLSHSLNFTKLLLLTSKDNVVMILLQKLGLWVHFIHDNFSTNSTS